MVAGGSGDGVTIANAGFTVKLNEPVSAAPVLSITVTVKVSTAAASGVTVKTPAELRLIPAGNPAPDQAYTRTTRRDERLRAGGCRLSRPATGKWWRLPAAALTGSVNEPLCDGARPRLRTVAVKDTLPAAGGVPVKTPVELIVSHAGRPVADQVSPVAPVAMNVVE